MDIKILQQPDDVTCGPTSLQAVYNHLGYKISLKQLISEIEFLEDGGTLGVFLGIDALKRGFKVTLHSYNLTLLDPTWSELSMPELKAKLELLHKAKHAPKLRKAIEAYIRFIDLGGKVAFEDLRAAMFEKYFKKGVPVLCGLSATYLYRSMREFTGKDDRSVPWGTLWWYTALTIRNSSWWPTPTAPTRFTRSPTTRSTSSGLSTAYCSAS